MEANKIIIKIFLHNKFTYLSLSKGDENKALLQPPSPKEHQTYPITNLQVVTDKLPTPPRLLRLHHQDEERPIPNRQQIEPHHHFIGQPDAQHLVQLLRQVGQVTRLHPLRRHQNVL